MILTSLTPFDRCTYVRRSSKNPLDPEFFPNISEKPKRHQTVAQHPRGSWWQERCVGSDMLDMLTEEPDGIPFHVEICAAGTEIPAGGFIVAGGNKKPLDDRSLWILKLKMDTRNWQYMHVYSTHLSESFRWEPIFKFSAVQNALSVFMFLGLYPLTIKQGNGNSISFICKSSRNGGFLHVQLWLSISLRLWVINGSLNGAFFAAAICFRLQEANTNNMVAHTFSALARVAWTWEGRIFGYLGMMRNEIFNGHGFKLAHFWMVHCPVQSWSVASQTCSGSQTLSCS